MANAPHIEPGTVVGGTEQPFVNRLLTSLSHFAHDCGDGVMQIGASSSSLVFYHRQPSTPNAKDGVASQEEAPSFSNMTPQQMVDAAQQLAQAGKLTLHQSGQMAVMDGQALASVNGGKLSAGSSNMYQMIDQSIAEQKANGDQFNAKADIASYKSLQSILQSYDANQQTNVSAIV